LTKYRLSRRAALLAPMAASSVAPVASGYEHSLRPCPGTSIAPRRRAIFRQTLLGRRITALAGEEATLTLVCDASDLPLACGPSGVSEMKPTVAPVTQTVPTALAAASIGLSLFVLPGGGGSLRPLPVVPAVNLVTGRIAASVRAPGHAAPASSRVSPPAAAGAATVSTSAGGARHASRPTSPRVRPAAPRRSASPPPVSSPRSTPAASPAPAAPPALGRGKVKLQLQAPSPPGLSRSAGGGHGRGHDRAQGAPQGPPAGSPGSQRDGGHDDHGSEQHRGGGP
jgi:polyphosphate kinase